MKIPVTDILHHRGDALLETFEYRAYCALFAGNVREARRILWEAHYTQYWTGVRTVTTAGYVRKEYEKAGRVFPSDPFWPLKADPVLVNRAVTARINHEIRLACDVAKRGCLVPPAGNREGDQVRLRDGHNRAAILAALGHKEIEVDVK